MKIILLSLLIELTLTYNAGSAVSYAKKYCSNYNRSYNSYKGRGGDCANFVCQCLKAGGLDLSGCGYKDDKGMLINCADLRSCLAKKGWKSKTGKPNGFKAGYPFFNGNQHAMIAIGVSGNTITYAGHTTDTCGSTTTNQNYVYYYL